MPEQWIITGCQIVTYSRTKNANAPCHLVHSNYNYYETIDNERMIRYKKWWLLRSFI